jgi:hypothetical protein
MDKHTYRPSSSGRTTPDGITPFPIRLIHERAPRRRRSVSSDSNKPQNDEFYRYWDRFLATSPSRALNTSALGRRLERTLKDASDEENGLHSQESPAASYEQAKKECQAKVQAIVAECTRLNQRYRDRQFEVELAQNDCIVPLVDDDINSNTIQPSGVKRIKVGIHQDPSKPLTPLRPLALASTNPLSRTYLRSPCSTQKGLVVTMSCRAR